MHPFEQGIFDRLMTGEPWTFDVGGTDKVIHIEAHLDDGGENIQSVSWYVNEPSFEEELVRGIGLNLMAKEVQERYAFKKQVASSLAFSDTPKNEDWPHHLMVAINEEVEEVNYDPALYKEVSE